MITLFCIHPHGFNIGNDAIHVALRCMVTDAFGRFVNVVSIPATSRFETHGRAGLSGSMVHEINQYADGVIIGGGNLFENGQLDINQTALEAIEPPMMMFSLSRGRVFNRRSELVDRTDVITDGELRALHEQSMLSVARDGATEAHLKGIGCENVVMGGCPTITLGDVADRLPTVHEPDQGVALLSVRNPSLMNIPLWAQARVRSDVERLVALLTEKMGTPPRLLCHDHRDIPFAASFTGLEYTYTGDVYSYLALLRAARVCVSYRLHASLPCLAFGVPFVNLSYDERSQSAIKAVGLGDWDVPVLEGDPVEAVAERLDNLDRLNTIVSQTADVRNGLRGVMAGAMVSFRDRVLDYAGLHATHSVPEVEILACTQQNKALAS